MIYYFRGDIFNSPAKVLVNPVNCVGVMGGGLALQFKKRYPENYKVYLGACKRGWLTPRTLCCAEENSKLIVNFPTKSHWRDPSQLVWVEDGLKVLRRTLEEKYFGSVAIPALGCGLGGLDWSDVRKAIEAEFSTWSGRTYVYEPW